LRLGGVVHQSSTNGLTLSATTEAVMNVRHIVRWVKKLDRSGATAIEYAFIGVLVSIAAFSVLVNIGTELGTVFQQVAGSL
jgi:Flp pilus assembly pilin Flp